MKHTTVKTFHHICDISSSHKGIMPVIAEHAELRYGSMREKFLKQIITVEII